jgi:hypothetical protein
VSATLGEPLVGRKILYTHPMAQLSFQPRKNHKQTIEKLEENYYLEVILSNVCPDWEEKKSIYMK